MGKTIASNPESVWPREIGKRADGKASRASSASAATEDGDFATPKEEAPTEDDTPLD